MDDHLLLLWETGRTAWLSVALPAPVFAHHLSQLLGSAPDRTCSPGEVHAGDLYLACACAYSIPGAHAALEDSVLRRVPTFLAHMNLTPSTLDEVQQILRTRLLVTEPDRPPRIAAYVGRGTLANWVRVTAVRIALNMRRGEIRRPEQGYEDPPLDEAPAQGDPELDLLKARYGREFRSALQAALLALSPELRNIMRTYYVEGRSTTEVAVLTGLSQPTVVRRLASARNLVFDETRRILTEYLSLSAGEVDSVIRLVQSQLDLSLSEMLG